MSFQNFGTTINGRKFKRTDGVLVRDGSFVLAGHVTEIGESDGEVYINAMVCQGVRGSMDAVPKPDPSLYVVGLRHQSSKLVRGEAATRTTKLFCFPDETPDWADDDAPAPAPPVVRDEPGGPVTIQPPKEEPVFHPADTDKSGNVDKKEQKRYDKLNKG